MIYIGGDLSSFLANILSDKVIVYAIIITLIFTLIFILICNHGIDIDIDNFSDSTAPEITIPPTVLHDFHTQAEYSAADKTGLFRLEGPDEVYILQKTLSTTDTTTFPTNITNNHTTTEILGNTSDYSGEIFLQDVNGVISPVKVINVVNKNTAQQEYSDPTHVYNTVNAPRAIPLEVTIGYLSGSGSNKVTLNSEGGTVYSPTTFESAYLDNDSREIFVINTGKKIYLMEPISDKIQTLSSNNDRNPITQVKLRYNNDGTTEFYTGTGVKYQVNMVQVRDKSTGSVTYQNPNEIETMQKLETSPLIAMWSKHLSPDDASMVEYHTKNQGYYNINDRLMIRGMKKVGYTPQREPTLDPIGTVCSRV